MPEQAKNIPTIPHSSMKADRGEKRDLSENTDGNPSDQQGKAKKSKPSNYAFLERVCNLYFLKLEKKENDRLRREAEMKAVQKAAEAGISVRDGGFVFRPLICQGLQSAQTDTYYLKGLF